MEQTRKQGAKKSVRGSINAVVTSQDAFGKTASLSACKPNNKLVLEEPSAPVLRSTLFEENSARFTRTSAQG